MQASAERIGTTGDSGTRNGRVRSGRVRRSSGTAIETSRNANSVPMLTSSASGQRDERRRGSATKIVVPRSTGPACRAGCTLATDCGSRPSRPMAKPIRLTVTRSTRITEVSPATAAMETRAAPSRADLVEGVRDRRARVEWSVVSPCRSPRTRRRCRARCRAERAEQAQRQVAARACGSPRRGSPPPRSRCRRRRRRRRR